MMGTEVMGDGEKEGSCVAPSSREMRPHWPRVGRARQIRVPPNKALALSFASLATFWAAIVLNMVLNSPFVQTMTSMTAAQSARSSFCPTACRKAGFSFIIRVQRSIPCEGSSP